jgi:hypothetical protein
MACAIRLCRRIIGSVRGGLGLAGCCRGCTSIRRLGEGGIDSVPFQTPSVHSHTAHYKTKSVPYYYKTSVPWDPTQ